MKVKVLREQGYEEAALGFSLSYKSTPERAKELFSSKAFVQIGENKFLESIYVWLDIVATREWWIQADTYRISTKQSESTMHTIHKRPLELFDFEFSEYNRDHIRLTANYINSIRLDNSLTNLQKVKMIKEVLPESFLQRRVWVMNYRTLQNVIIQREHHALEAWQDFIAQIKEQVEHPELLFPLYIANKEECLD
jgi:hypothetical protein